MKYKGATCDEHMPDKFHHTEWDDERIKKWAYSIGTCTGEVVDRFFASVRVKEQGYNSALSVLRLSKAYSPERLDVSCEVALERIRSPRYKNLKAILSSNQDQVFQLKKAEIKSKELNQTVQGYVRGSQYYSGTAEVTSK